MFVACYACCCCKADFASEGEDDGAVGGDEEQGKQQGDAVTDVTSEDAKATAKLGFEAPVCKSIDGAMLGLNEFYHKAFMMRRETTGSIERIVARIRTLGEPTNCIIKHL